MAAAPPARSKSIARRSAPAASPTEPGSIENPEISAGPRRTVPTIRLSFRTAKWDRCSSGRIAMYRSRWTLRSSVGRSLRPETKTRQYSWAFVVGRGSRVTDTRSARDSRDIKVRTAEILCGGRAFDASDGFRALRDAGDHTKDGPEFCGTGDRPAFARLRREPRIPPRMGEEDGRTGAHGRIRPGEVRRRGARHRMLRDHDRRALEGGCERRRDRGRLQWP